MKLKGKPKDVKNAKIVRIRFIDHDRMVHTQYRGMIENKKVGWGEVERFLPDTEYFKRKLQGK